MVAHTRNPSTPEVGVEDGSGHEAICGSKERNSYFLFPSSSSSSSFFCLFFFLLLLFLFFSGIHFLNQKQVAKHIT